ncbi:MAG TPA: P27 family phage terminase small subunit [Longimicrobiales bacterium]
MPGPLPKPTDRRQRRNQPKPLRVIPGGLVGRNAPPAPAGLLKATRDEWDTFWRSELAQLVQAETDLVALERLFRLRDEERRAMREARKARLVPGSMGQMVLNPLLKYAESLQKEIRALEDRFGMTPKARLALGIAFGEAARSLSDLNRMLEYDDGNEADEEDPRLAAL